MDSDAETEIAENPEMEDGPEIPKGSPLPNFPKE